MANAKETRKRRTPLGLFLARERYRRGLLQTELAERAGISESTLINLETGKHTTASAKVIYGLGKALEVDPGQLFDLMEEAENAENETR